MNQNYTYPYYSYQNTSTQSNGGDRIIGGFAFPFLLGGVTGAALAPAFWNNGYGYNRPPYYYNQYFYYPPYYYRPYY